MEKQGRVDDDGDYSHRHEEDKEKYRAALCVASLKHVKLNRQTALALHGLKNKVLRQIRARRNKPRSVRTEPNNNNNNNPTRNLPGNREELNGLLAALNSYNPPNTPPLPMLDGLIAKCSKPFGKQLTGSDVDKTQCRLSINKVAMRDAVSPLLRDGEDCSRGIPVTVYDEEGREYPMTLITWCSKLHVLKEGWNDFRVQHGLVEHQDFLTIWVFRKVETQDLCFVITSRRYHDITKSIKKSIKKGLLNFFK